MIVIEVPGILDVSGAEYQGAARVAVQGEVMSRDTRAKRVTVGIEHKVGYAGGHAGKLNEASRSEPVIQVFVPFKTQGSGGKGCGGPRRQAGNRCISPEPHLAQRGWHGDSEVRRSIDHEYRAAERVFRTASIGRRAK